MKKKVLVIGGIAATAVLVGGWALAQIVRLGPGGFGPGFMHGRRDGMGPGMMQDRVAFLGPGHDGSRHEAATQWAGHDAWRARLGDRRSAQIETLKGELAITPAQEPAWTKYAKTIQDAAAAMKTLRDGVDPDAVSKMSPTDRFAFVTKMREQGKSSRDRQGGSERAVATLDDKQKAEAQRTLLRVSPSSAPA